MTEMTLSEGDLAAINERLVSDVNGQIPLMTVIRVLRECAVNNPHESPEMVEQATRIQLRIRSLPQIPETLAPSTESLTADTAHLARLLKDAQNPADEQARQTALAPSLAQRVRTPARSGP